VPATHYQSPWQPNQTILDDDGAVLWRKWSQPVVYPLNQWQNNACLIPVNPDRDNRIDVLGFMHSHEITFRTWNGVELVDRPGWPKNFAPCLPTPPVVGDVDGDGEEDIIIGTYNPSLSSSTGSLYVFRLDGMQKFSVPVPGGLKHIPTIANISGDGLRVIYRSLAGKIYIQNFGASGQGTASSWSTHRGNRQRDGNFAASLFPPGTPLITRKEGGYRRASFSWTAPATNAVQSWRIYRAEQPEGPFTHVMTLGPAATSYTDWQLKSGRQYIYEVAAVYPTSAVCSAPFAMLSLMNSNLVANGGFEENDNSHWDKWFTGSVPWTNMVASTNVFHQGDRSMEITLINKGTSGTISQFGQYGTIDAYLPVTPGRLYSFGGFLRSGGISQPSEQWIEWGSTKTGEDTNNRPPLPYPNYFTPHFVVGTGPTGWTYANRTFVMPAGFPNVGLWHRYSVSAPASGAVYLDNFFFRSLPAPNSTNWTELIPFRATWRYSTNAPPAGWANADFNDAAWPLGTAKFGAGTGPTNLATILPQRKPNYYFRRTFVLPAGCDELLLSATCTDSGKPVEVYFNGTRLVTTGIEVASNPGNNVLYYDLTPFLGLLPPGTNTLAVVIGNGWQTDWDDVAFDLSLKTTTNSVALPAMSIGGPGGSGAGLFDTTSTSGSPSVSLTLSVPTNSIWRVESADAITGPWQLMEIFTNGSPGAVQIEDTGQNGRLPPDKTPTRYYRMVPD